MSVKKSVMILYLEFYHPQDIAELESSLRTLSKKKKFPAFRKLIPMINYRNMKGIRDVKTMISPPIITPDGYEPEQE